VGGPKHFRVAETRAIEEAIPGSLFRVDTGSGILLPLEASTSGQRHHREFLREVVVAQKPFGSGPEHMNRIRV